MELFEQQITNLKTNFDFFVNEKAAPEGAALIPNSLIA